MRRGTAGLHFPPSPLVFTFRGSLLPFFHVAGRDYEKGIRGEARFIRRLFPSSTGPRLSFLKKRRCEYSRSSLRSSHSSPPLFLSPPFSSPIIPCLGGFGNGVFFFFFSLIRLSSFSFSPSFRDGSEGERMLLFSSEQRTPLAFPPPFFPPSRPWSNWGGEE